MKVIFLDHDGVMCLTSQWGGRFKKYEKWCKIHGPTGEKLPVEFRFDNFDKKAVKVLNEILETTGAELVISSDWRLYCTLEEMQDLFEKYGVMKKPIGFTEYLRYGVFSSSSESRAHEIKKRLSEHPEVTNWVAVDDLNMAQSFISKANGEKIERDWGLTNFVLTPKSSEGIKQNGIKQKILNFLS